MYHKLFEKIKNNNNHELAHLMLSSWASTTEVRVSTSLNSGAVSRWTFIFTFHLVNRELSILDTITNYRANVIITSLKNAVVKELEHDIPSLRQMLWHLILISKSWTPLNAVCCINIISDIISCVSYYNVINLPVRPHTRLIYLTVTYPGLTWADHTYNTCPACQL